MLTPNLWKLLSLRRDPAVFSSDEILEQPFPEKLWNTGEMELKLGGGILKLVAE